VASNDDEEELLRSVALQNANSILAARQRAEKALLEANESLEARTRELAHSISLLRATLEATNDAILVTDERDAILEYNEQFLELWKLPRDIVDNGRHRAVLEYNARHFKDPESFLARVAEIYSSGQEVFDELWLEDGRVIERFSKIQYIDGETAGRVWSFRDISETKRAEELRSRLAAIVEFADDAIVSKTLQGIITSWNAGAQRTFGYSAAETIGQSITMLIPPDRINEEADILARLNRGERIDHYETVRVRKDGSRIDVSLSVSPVKDGRGKIIGASKIARDITQQRQHEQEREELLNSERAARSAAEHASRLKDEFLATLSHELRTPLNAILGWSQLLGMNPDKSDLEQGLDAIQRNARAQTQLIEDLLDMSRIISGKVRLDVQWTDLSGVVDAAVDAVRPAAEAKEIRLRKILDPHAGPVSGDPTRLQQIVWNLLTNAIKFTPRRGKVDILLERVNSHLEITVHDSGIGIKPDFLPLVFDRFRQVDSSTTREHGGLGLGLSIVKQLVELHGGTVRAKSAGEGEGATFIVSLPLAPIRPGEQREHPTTSKSPELDCHELDLAGVKVLLVDDEADARTLITRVLMQCKAEVRAAATADEGVEEVRKFQPDILISDIGMPGKDGYQFIREVRSLPAREGGEVPAIALTAFARSEDRTRAMLAGYQVHIVKPIEPQELLATVGSLARRTGKNP
jgi:PAS domain S-box-containing protein